MDTYEVLRKLMYENNVRKADVIRGSGVSRPTLVDWEKGRREPTLKTLRKLAKYFDVPVEVFVKE